MTDRRPEMVGATFEPVRLGAGACVLEQRLPLVAEISVVVARNAQGEVVHLPVQDNVHWLRPQARQALHCP